MSSDVSTNAQSGREPASSQWRWIRTPLYEHSKRRDSLTVPERIAFDEIDVIERIGSESSVGKVYRAVYKETQESVALKIFPCDANEVKIALALGALAFKDWDAPYPICFGTGMLTAEEAAQFEFDVDCHYLISELAVGDFLQMRDEAITEKAATNNNIGDWAHRHFSLSSPGESSLSFQEWRKEMAFQAYSCLQRLHKDGYNHLDCHTGNFMVLASGKMVVHDFGTSVVANTASIEKDISIFKEHWGLWLGSHALE